MECGDALRRNERHFLVASSTGTREGITQRTLGMQRGRKWICGVDLWRDVIHASAGRWPLGEVRPDVFEPIWKYLNHFEVQGGTYLNVS